MRASGANIQHAATKVTNRKDGGDGSSICFEIQSFTTSSVLLKHFVVIYIIKLREYIIQTGARDEKQRPEKRNAVGKA